MLPRTRVRVVRDTTWDGPWQREFTGFLSPNVAPIFWGPEDIEYFVVFDEPQIDCDDCGPYVKAVIRSKYIRVDLRGAWVVPAAAPRPLSPGMRVVDLDMVAQPDLRAAPEPDTLYRVSLPGIQADCYTDPAGRAAYVETVPGTVPNRVLEVAQAGATYVVHPVLDGRFAVVLRTDEHARLVEVAAESLAPVGSYGRWTLPLEGLLGGWPGQVSPAALLGPLGVSTVESLGRLGVRLSASTSLGRQVSVRLRAFYDAAGAAPTAVRANWSIDGQAATNSFPNA